MIIAQAMNCAISIISNILCLTFFLRNLDVVDSRFRKNTETVLESYGVKQTPKTKCLTL